MDMAELNAVYEEVLGQGPTLEDQEPVGAPPTGQQDGAYVQEDFSDDAEDGTDPRDPSTQEIDEEVKEYIDGEEPFEGEEVDDEEYEEIPERLVEAGRNGNLSERDIVQLAETHPEVLEALARAHEAVPVASPQAQQSAEKEPKQEAPADGFQPIKLDFTEDDRMEMGERSLDIIESLVDKVNKLGSKVAEQSNVTQSIQQRSEVESIRAIDSQFDGMAEKIPGLGNSTSLTTEQIANRKFAFSAARAAMESYGNMSLEQALTVGANALRGQMQDTEVKAKIVSDLSRNKKRFINRGRGQRKSKPRKSVDERALESINKVLDDPKYH